MKCERCNKFDLSARIVAIVDARSMDLCALCAHELQRFCRDDDKMAKLLITLDLSSIGLEVFTIAAGHGDPAVSHDKAVSRVVARFDARRAIYDALEAWLKEGRIQLFYVAHPVGMNHEKRLKNIASAKYWIQKLVEAVPDIGFVAPWLPYVEVLDEDKYRVRGIRDDLEALRRCDGIVAVGGQGMSSGMTAEWAKAGEWGLTRVNYSNRTLEGDIVPRNFVEGTE